MGIPLKAVKQDFSPRRRPALCLRAEMGGMKEAAARDRDSEDSTRDRAEEVSGTALHSDGQEP